MQIAFVGFQPIQSSEHMAAFGVFGLCQLIAFYNYAKSKLTPENFDTLFKAVAAFFGFVLAFVALLLTITGSE
jgi:dolichyl-diphosphooligosaccharide---protein glycosyltransferase